MALCQTRGFAVFPILSPRLPEPGAIMRVTVLGGGVCGLTSALRIKRAIPSIQLEVIGERIASRTAPDDITTSEGAAGLWKPFALSGTPDELVNRWGKETLDHYMEIYLSGKAPEAGILLSSAYELFEEPLDELPAWSDVVPAFRRLTQADIAFYDPSRRHVDGYRYGRHSPLPVQHSCKCLTRPSGMFALRQL